MRQYLFLLFGTVILLSCSHSEKSFRDQFGESMNAERESIGLATVDPVDKLETDPTVEGRRYIFIRQTERTATKAGLMRKIILLDSSKKRIELETDTWKNPSEMKYLEVNYHYPTQTIEMMLQDIPEKDTAIRLTREMKDSVLRSWKAE